MRLFLFSLFSILIFTAAASGQGNAAASAQPSGLSSWQHIQNLPPKTKVHITMDAGRTTCRIFAVSEDALTCATGRKSTAAGKVIARSEAWRESR